MEKKKSLKKIWNFLKEDSWSSLIVVLLLALVIIKFFLFPLLSFLTGSTLPLVIVESCSMHHYEKGFEKIFETSDVYKKNNIAIEDTKDWTFQNGFNKGDIIFVVGAKNVEVGDVIIFNAGARYPIIHRVIDSDEPYTTKGDNYKTNSQSFDFDKNISQDQVLGKALFKIPHLGWVKLIFFEFGKPANERGFCN